MARKKSLRIEAVFKGIDRITRPVKRMQSRLRRFSRSAKKRLRAVDRVATKLGRTMVRGVAAGFRAATVAAVAFGVAAGKIIKTGADFERTLVVAATRFPGEIRKGTAAFAELESAAAMAGKTTEFTATQAAQGLKLLGAAGLDVKQAIAVLPDVINLATVAEVELAEASDMAVKTLGAMGLASEDAATNQKNLKRVMDVMNQTANSASQTLGDVFEAFVIAGTEATEFNQSIETVSASIIAMARAGFVGEKAGTAYRNMMMRLTSLTPKSRKEIKRLGVALTDSAGNLRDPISLVGDLSEALDGLGTAERARRLNEIFGARAKGPFSKLIRAGTEQLREFEQAGKDAAGSLTRSAERIQDTTTGSMLQFKSAVEGVQISLFKLKDSAIKGVIDRVTEWIRTNEKLIVSKVGEWLDKIINNFDKIIDTLKKIGAIVGSLFLLVGAIKAVNAAVAAFDVIVALANPKALLIAAIITAIGVAAFFVVKHWKPVKAFFIKLWTKISEIFTSVINHLVRTGPISWFLASAGALKIAWEFLVPVFRSLWDGIKSIFVGFIRTVVTSGPVQKLLDVVDTIKEKWGELKTFFKGVWDGITDVFDTAIKWVTDKFGPFIDLLKKFFNIKEELINEVLSSRDKGPMIIREDNFDIGGVRRPRLSVVPLDPSSSEPSEAEAPRMVSPQDRISRSVSESSLTEKKLAEVTIRDETGRAEVTQGDLAQLGFQMLRTGTF